MIRFHTRALPPILAILTFGFDFQAHAWSAHQEIVNRILASPGLASNPILEAKVRVPCGDQEKNEIEALSSRIGIRAQAVPLVSNEKCNSRGDLQRTLREVLSLGFIDEPDLGMDQDLPDSADPRGVRKWMGGRTGPTSQGFRHMRFPGIEWGSPLRTLQIPFSPIGEAFERVEVLGHESEKYFKSGDLYFGVRTFLWREHLIQDLLQPFHTTPVPALSMLPWSKLFSGFVAASTHAIANYHYAYEGLIEELVRIPGPRGLQDCFDSGVSHPYSGESAHLSFVRSRAREVGDALYGIFGDSLKSKEIDLPAGVGEIDDFALANAVSSPREKGDEYSASQEREQKSADATAKSMEALRRATCPVLTEVSGLFVGDLDQYWKMIGNRPGLKGDGSL